MQRFISFECRLALEKYCSFDCGGIYPDVFILLWFLRLCEFFKQSILYMIYLVMDKQSKYIRNKVLSFSKNYLELSSGTLNKK